MTFLAYDCSGKTFRLSLAPARECILSWSARHAVDIDLRAQLADGRRSAWLPYVRRDPWRSCSSCDELVEIETDIIRGGLPITAIEVRAEGLDGLFLASPPLRPAISASVRALTRLEISAVIEVPAFSQEIEGASGWCAAASLAMVMTYWAQRTGEPSYLVDVRGTAAAIYDEAYAGTGNWTFATAFANIRGLRATVAYLRDLEHARRFILAQIPLVISIAWEEGELEGAPLPRSNGHLIVLRGFDREGFAVVNDPALPQVNGRYVYRELESIWLRAGGVCYAIAPRSDPHLLPLLHNP